MNILDELTNYIATKMSLEPGENLFYNSMPDEPDNCVLLQQESYSTGVPVQIDATCYHVKVIVRNVSNSDAYDVAAMVYRWLYTDKEDTAEADGLVKLSDTLTVATVPLTEPIWYKTDEKGRKYFVFKARVFSHRII